MIVNIALIILGLSVVLPLIIRPVRRVFHAVSISCIIVLLLDLAVHTGNEWYGGSGILRGIPRIFALRIMDSESIVSWTALELLLLLGIFCSQLGTKNKTKAALIDHVTYVVLVVLALANTLWLVSISFSVLLVTGLYTTISGRRDLHLAGRGIAAYLAVFIFALLGFGVISGSIGVNQGYGAIFSPEGYGGVLDQNALAVIRHATFSFLRIISVKYIMVAPILMGGTLITFSRVLKGSNLSIRTVCTIVAILLGIKLFPMLELGLRYADGLLLILFGFATMWWSVLSGDVGNENAETVALGGALLLIGAKSPVGAVLWVLAWLPGFLRHESLRFPGMILTLLTLVILNFQFFERIPLNSGFLMGISGIASVAIGITVARLYRCRRCYADGVIPFFILSLMIISSSFQHWRLWGEKIEISFRSFPLSAIIVISSLMFGWMLSCYFRNVLKGFAEQTIVVVTKAVWRVLEQWFIPLVDITAVIWVALERFLWQGITLFGPRRILYHISEIIGWFDSKIMKSMRSIPDHIVNALDSVLKRIIRFPGIVLLIIIVCVILWNLRGLLR